MKQQIFKATKFKPFKKHIFGFDIETSNRNKNFLMASIVGLNRTNRNGVASEYKKVFYSKDEVVAELKTNIIFRNSVIFATNLSFDFMGTFFNTDEYNAFDVRFMKNSGKILYARAFFDGDNFTSNPNKKYQSGKRKSTLEFRDSINYAPISVKKMGEIIGLPKGELKTFEIGTKPKTKEQWDELVTYNLRDSEITFKFMQFYIKTIEHLEGSFKLTLGSCAMSLYKNKYLNMQVYRNKIEVLDDTFKSYYGGRTEVLQRGKFENANYYDYNSLYPSVMFDFEFPNPNSQRVSFLNTNKFLNIYDGVTEVTISSPTDLKIPLLPFRTTEKLIFPILQNVRSWYSNVELRKALEIGYTISKVHKSIYYKENCKPFKGYVETLYNLRLKYKSEKNPMEFIVKLFMNSLYGKFGEKYGEITEMKPVVNLTDEEICGGYLQQGIFAYLTKIVEPALHCIPIWATYVTAYGRLKLYETLSHNPIYCDTDSIITMEQLPNSNKLGELKLECEVTEGVCVRPKLYQIKEKGNDDWNKAKVKGLAIPLNNKQFIELIEGGEMKFTRFAKFKESIRRGFIPNELLDETKQFKIEDTKRNWEIPFNKNELQSSTPLLVVENHIVPNLTANNNPIMSIGANSIGAVAPMMKYERNNIILPIIPTNDEL
jgi:hypothetical protein